MFKLPVFLIVFICIFSCNSNTILSEEQFTSIYKDSLAHLHPAGTYTIAKPLQINVQYKDREFIHHLENAYTDYKRDTGSLKEIMSRYLSSATDIYKDEVPLTKDKIIPIIKDARYLTEIAQSTKLNDTTKPLELVHDIYNEKLVIVYAENNESSMAFISEDRLKESGIPRDSLFPVAIRNLKDVLPEIKMTSKDGIHMITAGGNFEATLILLPSIWDNKTIPVKGKFVIAIPARDILFVTGSNDGPGISKVKEVADKMSQEGSYTLLPDLFIWNGKKFEVYKN